MLTLLSELRFWSQSHSATTHESSAEKQHPAVKYLESEKRTQRLRRNLKKLEMKLRHHKLVYCEWLQSNIVQLMLSNGLLAYIVLHPNTSNLALVAFDKYFIGKLVSEAVHNVIVSKMHILISYNENQITFVHLQRPPVRRSQPTKIHNMEPKIFHFVIGGSIRKTPRHLSCNLSCDLLAVWTKGSQMEVYPWRPTTKDQERANLHIYKLSRMKLELQCYFWTEFDPICIEFSKQHENQLHSIEQRISRKGVVSVESCIYQLNKSKLTRTSVTSIPLQTQACCAAFSPDHEKIMLGCIDASIILFDEGRGITHLVKAAFIPQYVTWHCDSALLMISNERCQLQCFDISLSCVKNQLLSDEISPSAVLDLSQYLAGPPVNLVRMCFSKKSDVMTHYEKYAQNDTHLIMCLDSGTLACLRIVGGAGMKGDIHKTGFTADVLVHNYISLGQVEKAINILLSLNWDAYGAMCLVSLHKIANFIFKQPLTSEREVQLQKALGSFHVPVKALCDETVEEFGDQVDDITRRFFHYMMRFGSFEKAFSLAIDINDADLFMDLYRVVTQHDRADLAGDALKRAEVIYKQIEEDETRSTSSHSTCSRSSCSQCMTASESGSESEQDEIRNKNGSVEELPRSKEESRAKIVKPKLYKSNSAELLNRPIQRPLKYQSNKMQQYMPPLPQPKTTIAQKIQIPKPELRNKMMTTLMNMKQSNNNPVGSGNNENLYENRPSIDRRMIDEPDNNNYGSFSLENLDFLSNRPPKPTPRSFLNPASSYRTSEDPVLNVIPTPSTQLKPNRLDQTIGIPVTTDPPTHNPGFGMFPQRTKSYFPAPFNNYSTNEFSYKPVFPVPPIIHNHPLIAGNIPSMYPMPPTSALKKDNSPTNKKEVNSILTNSTPSPNKRDGDNSNKEKNKVKFSDTVQIAVVPEMPGRKEKSVPISMKKMVHHPRMTNQELAESLPLCHPNDDYLKDFNPMPVDQRLLNSSKSGSGDYLSNGNNFPSMNKNDRNQDGSRDGGQNSSSSNKKPGSSVKVVHFGVV